ncbi:MAG TPA: response regulator [Clostridia bacterium]|nr:response regulator [Clostridia bacterium]
MGKTIVIADDEPITMMDMCEMLREVGYDVVGEAFDGFDAVEICRKHRPDLVLMDVKMPLLDGIKASKIIMNEGLADSVVLLTAYSGNEFVEQAKDAGVMGYLIKPIEEKSLLPAIEVAITKGKEIKRIKDDAAKIKEDLESRKIIERAKGILMKKLKISEEEAYSRLRKLSMDKRCSMVKIADAIILGGS